jgi:predicted SnoaL-like aldol condensation-catalyzing enzyme
MTKSKDHEAPLEFNQPRYY